MIDAFPTRRICPRPELIREAAQQIDILAVSGLFLVEEDPGTVGLLEREVVGGVRLRIALTDPDSAAIRRRAGEELVFDTLVRRAEAARDAFDALFDRFQASFARVWHTSGSPIL